MDRVICTGIFDDEMSQRFIRVLLDLANIGFKELYEKCIPDNIATYKSSLERSVNWSVQTILEDVKTIEKMWADSPSLYNHLFIKY